MPAAELLRFRTEVDYVGGGDADAAQREIEREFRVGRHFGRVDVDEIIIN